MIIASIIIGLAFYWLGVETNWLRVRLEVGESLQEYDKRILASIEADWLQRQIEYQAWLEEYHAPILKYGSLQDNQIDPRDKWLKTEEDLTKRRNGEMIYQRGVK